MARILIVDDAAFMRMMLKDILTKGGFEIAGEDKVFHPATARHFWQPGNDTWKECITVVSPEVKKPVALRYCFKNFQLGNMANAGGLPLFPFRTDNW